MTNEEILSDFWKEKMILLQRQNSRTIDPLLSLDFAHKEIQNIRIANPLLQIDEEVTESSISAEIYVASDFHIRLFIQRQTKISFYGKTKTGFEKLADAKLFNNPFPNLNHFLAHYDSYTVELYHNQENEMRLSMQKKVEGEFIKSLLQKKFPDEVYNLELKNNQWILTINNKSEVVSVKELLK